MRIAFHTLGCKLNYAETSTYERGFVAHGLEVVPWGQRADVYLVNTCSVTQHAESKCRGVISRAHQLNPDAPIVVTGCYAQLRRAEVEALPGVRLVFGAGEKPQVVPHTLALLEGLPEAGAVRAETAFLPAYSSGERTRSFLKVQDGCDNFCAYCTVPLARGRSRNLPVATLVEQAREIAAKGIREVVLTGVNTGDFGRTTGESFLSLLQALEEVEGIDRYRISSIEPNLLTDGIIRWTAASKKFLPHFHIPLQTGCDTLLRKVGRRYDTALFADRIAAVRRIWEGPGRPLVFFGIDLIVGLPGETEEMFRETVRFLEEVIRPAWIHVFPYSRRPGTRAASWPDQVQESVKTRRVAQLEALGARLHGEFVALHRGLSAEVLWESTDRGGTMAGYTANYIRVERPFDPARIGTIETVVL